MRLRVFIGSSSEALRVAYALQANLMRTAECTVWNQGSFSLSSTTIESLIEAMANADFAVFVFNPDDVSVMRGRSQAVARDNVIFELGLAIGTLGRMHAFIVIPDGVASFHLPTDLFGITAATYQPDRRDGNLQAALGPAATQIEQAIRRL